MTTTLMARPADAWADGWGTIDCAQAPTPQCQLQVGEDASSPAPPGTSQANEPQAGGGGGSAGADNLANCGYRPSAYEAPAGAVGSGLLPSAAWYEGLCSTTGVITNPVQVPSLTPADVARLARGQLGLPRPDLAASPATTQLVNLPTWLWLDSGWNDVTTTASVPGVSVTARAHPRSVTWSMGDGATVTCDGAGTPFRQSTDPRSASPDCGYTYRRSSAGQPAGAFAVSATVHWSIRWSGAGQSGTFPNLTTTSSTRFEVAESQALNVRPER
ncbi:hypothetical protein [Actinophytocola sp.]|uniref:hypothetical protein n=1 Tax=Actinophytocola sp. TaxID=1872138 RepID=UPI003D6A35F3